MYLIWQRDMPTKGTKKNTVTWPITFTVMLIPAK